MPRLADVEVVGKAADPSVFKAGNSLPQPGYQTRRFTFRGRTRARQIAVAAAVDIEDINGVDGNAAAVFMAQIEIGNHDAGLAWPISAQQFGIAPRSALARTAEAVPQGAV